MQKLNIIYEDNHIIVVEKIPNIPSQGDKTGDTDKASDTDVQIDLLIDRNDQTINLCEMKYSSAQYTITAEEDLRIRNRKAVFMRETETTKAVMVTMITTYGLTPGGYSNDIPCQVTMTDLFK